MAHGPNDRGATGSDGAAGLPDWAREPVLLGCHGGAGTTTLRVLLRTPWELGAFSVERSEIDTFGRPLVLVARDSVAAAARAADVAGHVAASGTVIAALAVVADGSGSEPRVAADLLSRAGRRAGALVRVPFVAGLRHADAGEADRVRLPKKAQQALAGITAACDRAAAAPPAPQSSNPR
ncbi:hypothetical protein [Streptomonospora wellingtoniae]|uniref:Uncharacterized protein n=1 Tax=Streptomonospora wellingtoniae TaxID=3075544 RepID=A0ABU2KN98_9ACTN|nr:hypothetical protein [Streptomonospora sp. DSM 45055]MDT0300745.1 hypothetical protein [Streptomonospora sp. DSM 45055]